MTETYSSLRAQKGPSGCDDFTPSADFTLTWESIFIWEKFGLSVKIFPKREIIALV